MHVHQLQTRLAASGAQPCHERRLLRAWAQARAPEQGRQRAEDYFPLALRQALPALWDDLKALVTLQSEHPADDGSARLLLRLQDGQMVEAVRLPRDGLCISSQVGCAVGCVFCMTGQAGLIRQLGSAEIVAQVVLARHSAPQRAVKKVVFMGMGEPAHNLEAVLEAIQLLGTHGAIAHKNLVFSTVGDERAFARLPQQSVKPALALSLHTTKPELREQLLPRAPRISPVDLIAAADQYARASGYPAQIQWTLLRGINDGDDEVEALIALMRGKHAMLNLIPYNAVDGLPYQRPDEARASALFRRLNQRGIYTRLRQSAGQDVEGGCGQLRARAQPVRWSKTSVGSGL